tara:strand:- start:128 stop:604 length:477 start_codon:yes stop_codon:yes gene_type:complete
MKIGDHYYLVYKDHSDCVAFKVEIAGKPKYNSKPWYRCDVISADFLERFSFLDGWLTPDQFEIRYPTLRSFNSRKYSVRVDNLYATWGEAFKVIEANVDRIQANKKLNVEHCERQLKLAEENLQIAREAYIRSLDVDVEELFKDQPNSYISPFTGEKQ